MNLLRHLFCVVAVILFPVASGGCGRSGSGGSAAVKTKPEKVPVNVQEVDFPAEVGRSELQKLATNFKQLSVLMQQDPLPYTSVESLGWTMSTKAQAMLDKYYHQIRKRDEAGVGELIEREAPEHRWMKASQGIRDLDLVAVNARRMALAAGTMNIEGVRDKFSKLQKAAGRCLPGLAPESQ